MRRSVESGELTDRLPQVLFLVVTSAFLLLRGRPALDRIISERDLSAQASGPMSLVISLGLIFVPLLGLIALTMALRQAQILGPNATSLLTPLLEGGFIVAVSYWIGRRLFPQGVVNGPLDYDAMTRMKLRRAVMSLGWGLAATRLLLAFAAIGEPDADAAAVILFLPLVVLSYLLFRVGRLLRNPPESAELAATPPKDDAEEESDPEAEEIYRYQRQGRTRRFVGFWSMAVAIAAPILLALGFGAAVEALFAPTIITMALFGTLVLINHAVVSLFAARSGEEQSVAGGLAPVFISFAVALASLPILALIWGASLDDLREAWTQFLGGFAIGTLNLSPAVLLTLLSVFLLGYLLTRFVQGTLRRSVMPRTKLDLGGQNAVIAGVGYVGIFISALVAVTLAGINLSSLAFVAGALSVGIGFGLQNIVQNFVSGIILLIERPIGEGDMIEVNGQLGYVRNIAVRSTTIETFDRRDVIVPNADLVSGQVTNWTKGNAAGRLILPIGVAYGTDPQRVIDLLLEEAQAHPMVVLNPPPVALFMAFGDSALNFELRAILRDVNFIIATTSELNVAVARRLAAEGIEVPFPQRDVWLRSPEEPSEDARPRILAKPAIRNPHDVPGSAGIEVAPDGDGDGR